MSDKVKKSRGWLAVAYDESVSEDWIGKLSAMGAMALISPLHDMDVCDDGQGTRKKPHRHVILLWEGPTTYNCAKALCDALGLVMSPVPMVTLRGSARYLCHLDNPDKAQYSPGDVIAIGGLDYDEIINSANDDVLSLYEIFDWIDAYQVTSFRAFLAYARKYRPDWAKLVLLRQRENVIAYQRSLRFDLRDDGSVG